MKETKTTENKKRKEDLFHCQVESMEERERGKGNVARKGSTCGSACHEVDTEVSTFINFPGFPGRSKRNRV
jgi:hypothetical protein